MAPYFQVDAKKYALIISGARFCDLARNRSYFGTANSPGRIYQVAERASSVSVDAKAISKPVRGPDIISSEYLHK